MAEDIQRYLDRIESQHYSKPKFMEFLTAILRMIDGEHSIIKEMPLYFYVHNATGEQLDIVGQYVGADRDVLLQSADEVDADRLDDETFRAVILSNIIRNQWDGTNAHFREIWDQTLGTMIDAYYRDNMDMSMSIYIAAKYESPIIELIKYGYIIPKPMGVGMSITMQDQRSLDIYYGIVEHKAEISEVSVEGYDLSDDYLIDESDLILVDECSVVLFDG